MGGPIRVLHVVVNMNRGGAETLIMNLYRNIDRSKIQFDFLTCNKGAFDSEIERLGGRIHRIPYISEVGHFQYYKNLIHFLAANNQYEIIHSHLDKMSGLVLRAAKKCGIPIRISHSHNTSSEGGVAIRIYKSIIGSFINNSASHLFSCSNQASRWLFGKNANQAILIKNGIDTKHFKYQPEVRIKIRESFNINQDSFVIGHIGRFCHQKNHSFLIDIFGEVLKINSNSYLILIGDGPLKPEIEKKVLRFGMENKVLFMGIRSDIPQLLNTFDALVFPSFHEGLPVTLIEAQGSGIPCVISDVITDEVDIGANLIEYECINVQAEKWAKKLFQKRKQKFDTTKYIQNKGYDITQTASWLQNYYLNIAEAKGNKKVNNQRSYEVNV